MNEPMNHEGIPRRSAADTSGEVARVLAKLEATGQDVTIVRILANGPAVLRPFVLMASALLYDAALPAQVREAVILWLAQRNKNTYEWAEHDGIARRVGLSDELVEGLRCGDLDAASPDQRLAIGAAAELIETGRLKPESWQSVTEAWGLNGALELVLSVGWWHGLVPIVIDALGLEVPDSMRDDPLPRFG